MSFNALLQENFMKYIPYSVVNIERGHEIQTPLRGPEEPLRGPEGPLYRFTVFVKFDPFYH